MKHVSATILTYNAAASIESCLRSLVGVADEIVVVDSGSTDRTVAICERYGCRVKQRPLAGYGAQRQYATSLATHNYILSLDADEALSPELVESIKRLKEEGFTHRVYSASRLNFFCGRPVRHCGWYPDTQIRLFDRRYANWNLRDVAERVIFRDSVHPESLHGDILHFRCLTPEEYNEKEMHHAAIAASVLAASCHTITPLHPLLEGAKAFLECIVWQNALADGPVGLKISAQRFKCARLAYGKARKLRNKHTQQP